jgi:hypothetical protein
MPSGTFQSGASDDPTASHDERCTLASHAITIARGCRCNRNRHRYRLSRLPPAPTRRMALAAQARRRYVSDAFRGARIRKDLGRPRHRRGADTWPRPDDEVTERCHGYQNYFFSRWTRPPNRTTLEARIHTSARSSRQPCLTLHRCAPPVQRPLTTGNSSALVGVMSWA